MQEDRLTDVPKDKDRHAQRKKTDCQRHTNRQNIFRDSLYSQYKRRQIYNKKEKPEREEVEFEKREREKKRQALF